MIGYILYPGRCLPGLVERLLPVNVRLLRLDDRLLPIDLFVLPVDECALPLEERLLPLDERMLRLGERLLRPGGRLLPLDVHLLPAGELLLRRGERVLSVGKRLLGDYTHFGLSYPTPPVVRTPYPYGHTSPNTTMIGLMPVKILMSYLPLRDAPRGRAGEGCGVIRTLCRVACSIA